MSRSSAGTIAVAGALAQRPGCPGHAWVFLSYLLGLRRLGYEVLFVDRLVAGAGAPTPQRRRVASRQWRWLRSAMSRAGLDGRFAALLEGSTETLGRSRRQLLRELARASMLLNVNGFLQDEELLGAVPRRVYLDIDPGLAQIWKAEGLADTLAGHDDYVTVGANVGRPGCPVPAGGRSWIGTLPPVLIDRWRPAGGGGSAFTSVGSWRGPFAPIEHRGVRYGMRAHEFRRFLSLPVRVRAPFVLALDIDRADRADRSALRAASWRLVDPRRQVASFRAYEDFLHGSLAEIGIAKGLYVGTRCGWFSDRSATYLACGKPVLAQDTGFETALPVGRGLLPFGDLDEAVAGAQAISGDLAAHSAAAREIAEEHLDSDVVLGRLLARLGT